MNSVKFTNAVGVAVYGRCQILPAAGTVYLAPAQAEKAGPDCLREEIRRRVAKGPVTFRLVLQIAKLGDKITRSMTPQSRGGRSRHRRIGNARNHQCCG